MRLFFHVSKIIMVALHLVARDRWKWQSERNNWFGSDGDSREPTKDRRDGISPGRSRNIYTHKQNAFHGKWFTEKGTGTAQTPSILCWWHGHICGARDPGILMRNTKHALRES